MPRTMENGTISTIAQLELVRRVAFVVQGPTYYFIVLSCVWHFIGEADCDLTTRFSKVGEWPSDTRKSKFQEILILTNVGLFVKKSQLSLLALC